MNSVETPKPSPLRDLPWDQLTALYRGTRDPDHRDCQPPFSPTPAANDAPLREKLSALPEVALAAGALAASACGRLDLGLVVMACTGVPAWLAAILASRFGRAQSALALHRSTATFMMEERAQLALIGRIWRFSAVVLGGVASFAMVGGLLSMLSHDLELSLHAGRTFRWLVFGLCVAALGGCAWRRKRQNERLLAAHIQLTHELELSVGDALSVPLHRLPAIVLATCTWLAAMLAVVFVLRPENLPDSPGNVLIVSDTHNNHARWLSRTFGFRVEQMSFDEATTLADDLAARGDRDPLLDLVGVADARGYGFLVLDLRDVPVGVGGAGSWTLLRGRREADRFAALSIGDASGSNTDSDANSSMTSGAASNLPTHSQMDPHTPWRSASRGHRLVSFGASPRWIAHDDVGARVAMVRAIFGQSAFGETGSSGDEATGVSRGKSATLLDGVLYHGLASNFWAHAIWEYDFLERELDAGRVHEDWTTH
ncbi:MAG: hypothetical protein V3V08_11770 [Nannocystaceae bacterium]